MEPCEDASKSSSSRNPPSSDFQGSCYLLPLQGSCRFRSACSIWPLKMYQRREGNLCTLLHSATTSGTVQPTHALLAGLQPSAQGTLSWDPQLPVRPLWAPRRCPSSGTLQTPPPPPLHLFSFVVTHLETSFPLQPTSGQGKGSGSFASLQTVSRSSICPAKHDSV